MAVRRKERDGPVTVTLTTDLAPEAFLHWGVRRGRKSEWLPPPDAILPEGSLPREGEGALAIDTPFLPCSDDDCSGIEARSGSFYTDSCQQLLQRG